MNQLIIDNFIILCAYYKFISRFDLQNIHEHSLERLKSFQKPIYSSNIPLTVSNFDGINTRNKVLKIIQSKKDLDEVAFIKKHELFEKIMNTYVKSKTK